MSPVLVSILALIALFVVGTVLPINMGALGFVAAWLVGMYSLGLTEREIVSGISGDLILTLVGVTYLFAIARNNGTVDLIVRAAVRAVGGRVALIPWVMFAVTAVLTAIGAASPAACAIIGPIALGFAGRYRINVLMMGMMVVHGAQAGGFSPISIYGVITNSVMAENNLPVNELAIFLSSLLFNLAIAIALFFALGGRQLMSRRLGRRRARRHTGRRVLCHDDRHRCHPVRGWRRHTGRILGERRHRRPVTRERRHGDRDPHRHHGRPQALRRPGRHAHRSSPRSRSLRSSSKRTSASRRSPPR